MEQNREDAVLSNSTFIKFAEDIYKIISDRISVIIEIMNNFKEALRSHRHPDIESRISELESKVNYLYNKETLRDYWNSEQERKNDLRTINHLVNLNKQRSISLELLTQRCRGDNIFDRNQRDCRADSPDLESAVSETSKDIGDVSENVTPDQSSSANKKPSNQKRKKKSGTQAKTTLEEHKTCHSCGDKFKDSYASTSYKSLPKELGQFNRYNDFRYNPQRGNNPYEIPGFNPFIQGYPTNFYGQDYNRGNGRGNPSRGGRGGNKNYFPMPDMQTRGQMLDRREFSKTRPFNKRGGYNSEFNRKSLSDDHFRTQQQSHTHNTKNQSDSKSEENNTVPEGSTKKTEKIQAKASQNLKYSCSAEEIGKNYNALMAAALENSRLGIMSNQTKKLIDFLGHSSDSATNTETKDYEKCAEDKFKNLREAITRTLSEEVENLTPPTNH